MAEPLLGADRDAAVRPRAQAVNAFAALGREERHDVVAGSDKAAAALADGDWARLVSRRGDLEARASITDRVYPGLVWMALHFAQAKVNWLTHDVGDPLIGTPEYKVSAVRVEPIAAE